MIERSTSSGRASSDDVRLARPDSFTVVVDAAWVGGAPVAGARLTVDAGRVVRVEPARSRESGWLALPAFANAHVHLDLTSIHGEELRHATFAQWVDELLRERARLAPEDFAAAAKVGAEQLLATGTAAIGDVDSSGAAWPALRESPLEGVVHRELLGTPSEAALAGLEAELATHARPRDRDDEASAASGAAPARLRLGVSPHAPYSAGEALCRRAFEWRARHGAAVQTHVAESLDEERLLVSDDGPLAELFARRSFRKAAWSEPNARPFARLAALAPPRGFVVVHGNRLDDAELDACVAQGWPLVHCPRSHAYFGRTTSPVRRLLERGGVLALGTDSRASNVALDLWGEMAALRAAEPPRGVSDAALLAAATSGGRSALELAPAELRAGDVATFQLARARDGRPRRADQLVAAAVRGELATAALFARGRLVFGDAAALPFDRSA